MNIAFLTLFLGLTSGVHPFELSVGVPVAAVEIVLDGAVVERLSGPPWTGEIDFGPDLVPRDLVARALDAAGREITRTRQSINLPRPPAEVEIALEGGRPGAPAAVRLFWERLTYDQPLSISLLLDGQPLELDARHQAILPAYDPGSTHVVTAEVLFPSNVVARKDVIFGGQAGETYTDLTAVPVRLRGRDPQPVDLQGALVLPDGTPLQVFAVERGPAELYLVRVPSSKAVQMQYNTASARRGNEIAFSKDDRIRLVSPWARTFHGQGGRSDLFDVSPFFLGRHGLLPHLVESYFQQDGSEQLRFADAVAVAGLHATAGGHRRAVVLMLDAGSEDASRYDPAAVQSYLSAIRVPLHVWSLSRHSQIKERLADWGNIEPADDPGAMGRAFLKVAADLDRQRIVWVHGRHLPQSIRVSPEAKGIEIVAATEASPARRPEQEPPSVTFLTRYPHLVTGPQPLDVKTTGPAAGVEVLLDGRSLGRLNGPPWAGTLHLGSELLPHELVVRALDGQGREIARAREGINLPPLPAFPAGRAGREKRGAVMTPVPVRLTGDITGPGDRDLPSLEELQGKLMAGGKPLRVVSVERGRGEVLIVRVPDREEIVARFAGRFGPLSEKNKYLMSLGRHNWIRMFSPRPRIYPVKGLRPGLFNSLPGVVPEEGGLLLYLRTVEFGPEDYARPKDVPLEVRYSDAVAMAGFEAAATGHRRAVALILGSQAGEQSRYAPAEVRRYLDSLGVPLYVWNMDDPAAGHGWGETVDLGDTSGSEGFPRLRNDLDRQLTLWVEGRHLVREIRLAPDVEGLELLAR